MVPHSFLRHISTRPSVKLEPPTNLMDPSLQPVGNIIFYLLQTSIDVNSPGAHVTSALREQ